jgi:hypothetical protein
MKRSSILALAAVLAVGVSLPALAAWDRIGTVDFDWRGSHESQWGDFGGRVERLNFRAEGNGVQCKRVRATFGDGNTRRIFDGYIGEGRSVDVDLPGRDRRLSRLDFNCRSDGRRNARIVIAADIGRYRDEWRRGPNWDRWARAFNWDNDRRNDNQFDEGRWVRIGRESFEGGMDGEVAYAGWAGRNVQTLALKPLNGDARCRRVSATFDNGHTRDLNINGGEYLRQGGFYRLDLPGGERDVRSVKLRCRPIGDFQVTIELYAEK